MLLFRAVSWEELISLSASGTFSIGSGSYGFGKWFAVGADAAAQWGTLFSADEGRPYFVVEAQVTDLLNAVLYIETNLDNIGDAVLWKLHNCLWFRSLAFQRPQLADKR